MAEESKRSMRDLYVIIAIVIAFLIGGATMWILAGDSDDDSGDNGSSQGAITSFDECVDAGNPVMESFPEQCTTEDGETFVNDVSLNDDDENEQSSSDGQESDPDENTSGEIDESPTTQYDMSLFGLTVPDDFTETDRSSEVNACGDGKTRETLDFEAADGRYLNILVNDCGRGVNSDITLSFQYVLSTLEFLRPIDLTLCDPGPFCNVGDGALDVFASTQEDSPLGDRYFFFFGNSSSEDVDQDEIDEMIAIIETIVLK